MAEAGGFHLLLNWFEGYLSNRNRYNKAIIKNLKDNKRGIQFNSLKDNWLKLNSIFNSNFTENKEHIHSFYIMSYHCSFKKMRKNIG